MHTFILVFDIPHQISLQIKLLIFEMGSFQSKLTGEVPVVGTPGSPSESQPLNNGEKPMAPFRDPRSISDDVERTPIQIAAEKRAKKNEASKENEMPALNETPTAPSLPSRFKVNINEANMTLSPKMISRLTPSVFLT